MKKRKNDTIDPSCQESEESFLQLKRDLFLPVQYTYDQYREYVNYLLKCEYAFSQWLPEHLSWKELIALEKLNELKKEALSLGLHEDASIEDIKAKKDEEETKRNNSVIWKLLESIKSWKI